MSRGMMAKLPSYHNSDQLVCSAQSLALAVTKPRKVQETYHAACTQGRLCTQASGLYLLRSLFLLFQ